MIVIPLTVTTIADGSGSASANLGAIHPSLAAGALLYAVEWNVGTYDAGVDATITTTPALSATAQTVATLTNANADAMYHPRKVEVDTAGTTLTSASLPLLRDVVTLNVTGGGNTKTGNAYLHVLGV